MIPVLFKEDETVFNHNGIGALYESLSCIVYEEENGQYSLELEYPVDGEWFKEIKDLRIIQAKPNDIDEPHNFTIYEIDKSLDELTVYVRAETSTNNELRSNLISAYIGSNVTPQQAMNGLKSNLLESTNLTFYSDIQTRSNVEWVRINPLSALVGIRGSMVDIWGGEMKRSNNTIYFYSRRGRDKIATVRVGKNIEGLRSTVSTAGLITKILPHYTYTPVEIPKYEIVTYQDGRKEKRRVSNTGQYVGGEVTVLGNHVSSQYVNNHPRVYWADVDYGDDQELNELVRNFIDTRMQQAEDSPTVINNNNFPTELKNFIKTELDKRAKLYFTDRNPGVDQPTVRMTVDLLQLADSPEWEAFARLEQIGLTDTVEVYVPKFDMDIEVRITGLTYDSLAEQTISIDAGSRATPRMTTIEREYADTTKKLKDHINTIENGVQNVVMNSADGSVRKFHGYTMPDDSISSVGDMWFKDIGEGKTEIWIYDGVYWQVQMNEDFALDIIEQVEKVERESEESLNKINQTNKDIQDAIAEAGFTTLPEALSEIQDKMDTARFDQEIVSIVNDIATAKNEAAEALGEARKKVDSLEFDNTIDSLVGDIQESKDSAAQALTEAQKKVNTIDFNNIVNDIETGVQDAMDEAELATNTLRDSTGQLIKSQDLKVNIDGITSSLTSYAKTTDLNGLATETFVTNKGYQTASQVNTTLASYAKTTDLNGLVSQTWVENKGYATASEVSSELSSYAKTSALTGLATETYVTTRGYQTASQITTTLSAYEKTSTLNTKLAGKANVGDIPSLVGYAKESWVENKSYATAASVTTSLTAYEKITDVNAKLADKADIDDIPDITGLASETWVENKSYATAASVTTQLSSYAKSSDLNGLASESFVTNKGYQTAAQVSTTLSSYAKSSDLSGLATETFVTSRGYQTASQISTTLTAYEKTSAVNTKLAGKANVGDIPSLTGYAKESWVENKSYATAASVTTSLKAYEKITDVDAKLANKANSSDIPSIAGLASETWVENKSYATAASVATSLTAYEKTAAVNTKLAGKANVGDIPSIAGLASETWVENKSYATAASVTTQLSSYARTSDLNGLATETFVTNKGYQTAAQVTTTLSSYAKTSQLTGLATETFVTSKGYQTASQVSTTLAAYAKTTDLSGLATESYVTSRGYQTAAQITTTLAAYAKTSQLSGLATETFVTNKGYQTAAQVTTTLSSYVKTTTLSGYATVATVNAIKSTADTNKTTISTNTGKISTIEQTVSGLQTTVASKAAQSQVTQLSNSLSSVVTDLSNVDVIDPPGVTGKTFRNVHTFYSGSSSINGMVRINTPITKEAMTTIRFTGYNFLSNNSTIDLTVSFYAYSATGILNHSYTNRGDFEITNVRVGRDSSGRAVILLGVPTTNWKYASIDVEYVKVSYTTPPDSWKDGWSSSLTTVTTGITALTTLSGMDTQSRITQNATNINLRVQKNDVINQINISTEGVLIGSAKNKLNITATTTYIANATIKSAHIEDLAVTNAKIANGTIASAKIANLDVAKLNGNITTFMRSSWNSATGGSVTIAGSGIQSAFNYAYDGAITNSGNMVIANGIIAVSGSFSHSHGSTYMKINADSIYGENLLSNGTVRSLFSINGDGVRVNKLGNQASFEYDRVIFRQFAGIRYYDANARIEIQSYNGVALGSSQTNGVFLPRLTVGGGASGILPFIDAHVRMNMQDVLNMGNNELMNAYSITGVNNVLFGNTSNRLVLSANGALNILSPVQTQIGHYAGGAITNVLIVSANYVNIYKPMSMNGNAITNQSDGRKKDFISDATINSLSAIESWRFVGFNYKKGLNYAEGRQFGLIAQDTPDLALYDSVQDNWSINSSKQIMMNSHAIQQLVKRESNTNLLASNAYLKAESNEDKIKRLEDRIEELEGVM